MTPADFKAARHTLNLSTAQLARLFRVSGGRTVRRWESGESAIPGPAQVLINLLQARLAMFNDRNFDLAEMWERGRKIAG